MKFPIIYSSQHKQHAPLFEIYDDVKEEYSEKPARIETIKEKLEQENAGQFFSPSKFPLDHIKKIHHYAYIDFLKNRSRLLKENEVLYPSYFITDTYIAITPGTYDAAVESVNIALTGAQKVLDGEKLVYSLCRPPGHHAEERSMGGYCFFNNAAIAANFLTQKGKVALLDIDFHHGNGTQQIFYERSDVLYVSIHADPKEKYPYKTGFMDESGKGAGEGFTVNYPLPLGVTDINYMSVLKDALSKITEFNPEFIVLSAGFDTYENDPIGGFKLTVPFYEAIGQEIKALNTSTLVVQEGGYAVDALGEMAYNFLKGLSFTS
ncbi:MAG TPA: histone deacetylase family protein [Candidatus Levybacteria bacterium]|nr:histone deacetylase family protein [Candidatus Levybacteria bacterium]